MIMVKRISWLALVGLVLAIAYGLYWDSRNPFDGVVFVEDTLGATSRYVTFTPVLKSNRALCVGPVVGADFGELRFDDVDGDGIHEAIIETQVSFLNRGEFYSKTRQVLKMERGVDGVAKIRLMPEKGSDTTIPSGKLY